MKIQTEVCVHSISVWDLSDPILIILLHGSDDSEYDNDDDYLIIIL